MASQANHYTITIQNNSGNVNYYAIFAEYPKFSNSFSGSVWSNVFFYKPAAPNQTLTVTIYKQYYGLCGLLQGTPADGVVVTVNQKEKVTLGENTAKGTTLNFTAPGGVPQFPPGNRPTNNGDPNAFEIVSDSTFTTSQAKSNDWFVGIGASSAGSLAYSGPLATWTPNPQIDYQVQPSNTYWVTFGNQFSAGTLVKVKAASTTNVAVDFDALTRNDVTILHDDKNNLTPLP